MRCLSVKLRSPNKDGRFCEKGASVTLPTQPISQLTGSEWIRVVRALSPQVWASRAFTASPACFILGSIFLLQDGMATSQHVNPGGRLMDTNLFNLLQSSDFRQRTFSSFKIEVDFICLPRVLRTNLCLMPYPIFLLKKILYLPTRDSG